MHIGLLVITVTVVWSSTGVQGQGILPAESSLSLDPVITLISCLRDDRPTNCLQKRALGFFQSWLTTNADDGDVIEDGDGEDPNNLPGGISPYWSKMVDQIAEKIAGAYGGKEEDEEEDEDDDDNDPLGKNTNKTARNEVRKYGNVDIEDGRGHHKKKKIKAIKKAIIKLVLIAVLIKHKLKMLLTAFHTFLTFKAVLLASILVIIHAVKLWIEHKHKHHPQKVIYYENAHHQHHYDDHHHDHDHDDHHHGWSLWGRSGDAATTPSSFYPGITSFLSKRSSDLAYSAYNPEKQ